MDLKILPVILICCICQLPVNAVQNSELLTRYAAGIINFNREHPQEKVYIHMDNRNYFLGDTIWFKAYVVNAVALQPSGTSGVLYVELLDENGVEKEHKKLPIQGGMCHGEFVLKEEYRTGYYEIRAYTRNMLNFGNEAMPWTVTIPPPPEKIFPKGTLPPPPPPPGKDILYEQSLVADANHSLFSRVFPVYMKPERPGLYKRQFDWYPLHTQLAYPVETEEELREDSLRIGFYPEGGALVDGVTSLVALEVTDQWGRIKPARGRITQGRYGERQVAAFEVKDTQRGRGGFILCPEAGHTYYAHVTYRGKTYHYALPKVEKSGYGLMLRAPVGRSRSSFIVSASPDRPSALVGWTLQCRGALTLSDTLRLAGGESKRVIIPAEKLLPGVNQLTLFDGRGEILADRLFFVSPPSQQAHISLSRPLPDSVAPYQNVELDLQVKGSNGSGVEGGFSIAITDADEPSPNFDTGDLRSELLLSSDLKGFIRDVDSYFRHSNDTAMTADIDLLMLVQGWRRYEWCTMAGKQPYERRYAPEKGLLIDGYVITDATEITDFPKNDAYKRLGNLKVDILFSDNQKRFSTSCTADSLGRFHLELSYPFSEEVPMTIRLSEIDGKLRKKGIYSRLKFAYPIIHRAFSPAVTPYSYYQNHTPDDDELLTFTENLETQMEFTIPEVEVKKRNKRKSEIHFEYPDIVVDYYHEWNNIIDRGIPQANYLEDIDLRKDILDVNGLIFSADGTTQEHTVLFDATLQEMRLAYTFGRSHLWGAYRNAFGLQELLQAQWKRIIIGGDNGLTDTTALRSTFERAFRRYRMPKTIKVYSNLVTRQPVALDIDASTIARPYAYMVIDYFNEQDSPRGAPYMLQDGIRDTYFEGYSVVRDFYSPDYSECALPDSADYRRTLYWNPDVQTDSQGRASVTFYNSKQTKHLHVRAEGFTRFGEMVVYDSEKEEKK